MTGQLPGVVPDAHPPATSPAALPATDLLPPDGPDAAGHPSCPVWDA